MYGGFPQAGGYTPSFPQGGRFPAFMPQQSPPPGMAPGPPLKLMAHNPSVPPCPPGMGPAPLYTPQLSIHQQPFSNAVKRFANWNVC
jgi:hypothetical protein